MAVAELAAALGVVEVREERLDVAGSEAEAGQPRSRLVRLHAAPRGRLRE
jgi:hypothetical protein